MSEYVELLLVYLASFHVFFQKLHVFLFTELLVLTRPVTRNERHCFQVYRQPIPVQDLVLEDLQDGDVRMGGSFRGAFGNADKGEERYRICRIQKSMNKYGCDNISIRYRYRYLC